MHFCVEDARTDDGQIRISRVDFLKHGKVYFMGCGCLIKYAFEKALVLSELVHCFRKPTLLSPGVVFFLDVTTRVVSYG